MIGTWRWNVVLGLCGALLTLPFSLGGNGLHITGFRCLYAFLAFYGLAYFIRAALSAILRPRPFVPRQSKEPFDQAGAHIDLATPDESEQLRALLKEQPHGGPDVGPDGGTGDPVFTPLSPPKLVSTQNKDPEQLAQAIRHLTGG
ncbi:hypothetical protein [Paenibacillus humicola]|uniref:hypothetical protein n=1 Tax=Paenibacillus humicola TaxID=3110540 RepID=UPI00237BB253|nr:hypothetical protein [Paenibacillus humicola]